MGRKVCVSSVRRPYIAETPLEYRYYQDKGQWYLVSSGPGYCNTYRVCGPLPGEVAHMKARMEEERDRA